ncbi:MAG: 30S ribosomal protein S6 [Candidatus Taylorbacteria bacterium]|nr:30S ribosomal protein S6 [Candidatus Taylorbacteria bacterium]
MNEAITGDRASIYEVSYLIADSIPEEKALVESEAVKKIILDSGASIIAEENPHRECLAYEIRKKTVSGAYDSYDQAYFGWIKLEVGSEKIEAIRKAVEIYPAVLRALVISTVRENTYLGKKATVIAASFSAKTESTATRDNTKEEKKEVKKEAIHASTEDIDKSIDEMVKTV